MDKKEKEELSEAIGDGILDGFTKIVWQIAIASIVVIVAILSITFIGNYWTDYELEKCVERGECIQFDGEPVTSAISYCFPLETVSCEIIASNETYEELVDWFSICSYQEANEKYKMLKGELEYYLEKNNLSYELRMECD